MSRRPDRTLLDDLARHCRGLVAAGATFEGELVAGDLVAHVQVKVRRRVTVDQDAEYRAQAFDLLGREPWRACQCSATTRRRKPFSRYAARCTKPIAAVIVSRSIYQERVAFDFVCLAHRDHDGLVAARVLAVVQLPKRQLDELRARHERERAEADRQDRAQELGARAIVNWLGSLGPEDELALRRAAKRRP